MSAARLILRRLAAFALDVAVLAVVLVPLAFAVGGSLAVADLTGTDVWLRIALTVSLPAWTYFIACDRLADGRSPGKRLLGLRAATLGGGRIGWTAGFVRTALRLLPWELTHAAFFLLSTGFDRVTPLQMAVAAASYVLMLAYLVIALVNGGSRSLPDLAAGTRVTAAAGQRS